MGENTKSAPDCLAGLGKDVHRRYAKTNREDWEYWSRIRCVGRQCENRSTNQESESVALGSTVNSKVSNQVNNRNRGLWREVVAKARPPTPETTEQATSAPAAVTPAETNSGR